MDNTIVRVRSLIGGHYRVGRYFGTEPTNLETRSLTRRELLAIESDHNISIEIVQENEQMQSING